MFLNLLGWQYHNPPHTPWFSVLHWLPEYHILPKVAQTRVTHVSFHFNGMHILSHVKLLRSPIETLICYHTTERLLCDSTFRDRGDVNHCIRDWVCPCLEKCLFHWSPPADLHCQLATWFAWKVPCSIYLINVNILKNNSTGLTHGV